MACEVVFRLDLSQELPADIKDIAAKQGEIEDTKCDLVDQFRKLIFEKGECTPHRTDDEYLIKFLRARYWKIDLSYTLLCNYCQFRKNNSFLYENVRCIDLITLAEQELLTVTPYREANGQRMLILRFGTWDPKKMPVDDVLRLVQIVLEMGSMEPISQVTGGIGLFDMSGLSMSQALYLTPSVAQKIIAMIVTSSPLRTSAVHIINQSWIFSTIISMFKPLLSARMKERLFVHGSDMSSLHKHIDPKYLPKRYGGVHEDYSYVMWKDSLRTDEKIKWELEQLGYDVIDYELTT